jgi:ADP-ribosylglycohydrolase
VRDRLGDAQQLDLGSDPFHVVAVLGNGSRITAQDTVAFAIWVAANHLDDYAAGLWFAASARGDLDTNCAIVGGIIGARVGWGGIPAEWLSLREPLPTWHRP